MHQLTALLIPHYRAYCISAILLLMPDCMFLLLEGQQRFLLAALRAWESFGLALATTPGLDPMPPMDAAAPPTRYDRGHMGFTLLRRIHRAQPLLSRPFSVLVFSPENPMNPLLNTFRVLVPTVEALAALASPYYWNRYTLHRTLVDESDYLHASVLAVHVRAKPMEQFLAWAQRERDGTAHPDHEHPSQWWPTGSFTSSDAAEATSNGNGTPGAGLFGRVAASLAGQSATGMNQCKLAWLGSLARDIAHDEAVEWGLKSALHLLQKGGRLERVHTGISVIGDVLIVSVYHHGMMVTLRL